MSPAPSSRGPGARRVLVPVLLLLFCAAFTAVVLATRVFAFPPAFVDLDFSAYWTAARMAFTEGVSPYDSQALESQGAQWLPRRGKVPPFLYTPAALLGFGSLEGLAFPDAGRVMLVINLLAALGSLAFMTRALGMGRSRRLAGYSAAYLLCFAPFYEGFGLGQVNPVLLLLLCGVWHAYRTGHAAWTGGVAGALALFLKLHFGLLMLPLLLRRQWRVLRALAVAGAAGVALSAAVFPFNAWADWYALVVRGSSAVGIPQGLLTIAEPTNLSVPAMLARYLVGNPYFRTLPVAPALASAASLLACGAILAWTGWVLWRSSRLPHTPERADAELCLVLAAAFEVSPISWAHHQVFLLPAVLLLGRGLLTPGAPLLMRGGLGAALFLMAIHPEFLNRRDADFVQVLATLRSLATLGVWACLSAWVLRSSLAPQARGVSEAAPSAAVT